MGFTSFRAIFLVAIVLAALNFKNIKRLIDVNSLFAPDKIVYNFSHTDALFFSQPLKASGEPFVWQQDLRSLPETVTIDGKIIGLSGFLEDTMTTSLIVIKGDTILFEQYYLGTEADDKRISWSMAKSFLSAMLGVSVANGQIKSLDDKVSDYVPALKSSAYKDATIRNVLHMSSGVKFDENYLNFNSDINRMGRTLALGRSMDKFVLSLTKQSRAPDTGREYVSIDTHVIGMVLRAASGKSITQLFEERLWSKIGASSDAAYLTDGDGVAFVLGGLNVTSRDYALFGKLFRDGGKIDDRQIIPADWTRESTKNNAPKEVHGEPFGYGYQWWTPHKPIVGAGEFYANGIYGQTLYINPAADMIVLKTSAYRGFEDIAPSGLTYEGEFVEMAQSLVAHFSPEP